MSTESAKFLRKGRRRERRVRNVSTCAFDRRRFPSSLLRAGVSSEEKLYKKYENNNTGGSTEHNVNDSRHPRGISIFSSMRMRVGKKEASIKTLISSWMSTVTVSEAGKNVKAEMCWALSVHESSVVCPLVEFKGSAWLRSSDAVLWEIPHIYSIRMCLISEVGWLSD